MRQKLELVVWILAKVNKKALKHYAGTMTHYDYWPEGEIAVSIQNQKAWLNDLVLLRIEQQGQNNIKIRELVLFSGSI